MDASRPAGLSRPEAGPRTAVVWLTSFDDPQADAAFARLKAEAAPWGQVVRVRHRPGAAPAADGTADLLRVTDEELDAAMPSRYREMTGAGLPIELGFVDMLQIAVMDRLVECDRVWFLEYDVDFSGHWAAFFSCFDTNDADLLGTALIPRAMASDWVHWPSFLVPAASEPGRQARGFFPIARLSRRFADAYRAEVQRGWGGHYEALYPTIGAHLTMRIEDIGGEGPLTPVLRRGLFYTMGADPGLTSGTFRFEPPVSGTYHQELLRLPANHLWHPVKTQAYFARKGR